MISSAIWDKSARVNFSKDKQNCSLKNLRVLIYPKLHEKIMRLLVNIAHTKILHCKWMSNLKTFRTLTFDSLLKNNAEVPGFVNLDTTLEF